MDRTEKETRILKEERRLKRIYKDVDKKKRETCIGLIQRLAYIKVNLEDFEKDLDENGFVEDFQQGKNQEPYKRKRPVAEIYNSMNTLYQKGIKQLTDLLPKVQEKPKTEGDDFDSFVVGRDDI